MPGLAASSTTVGDPESTGMVRSEPPRKALAKAKRRPSGDQSTHAPVGERMTGDPQLPSGLRRTIQIERSSPPSLNSRAVPSGDQTGMRSCVNAKVTR